MDLDISSILATARQGTPTKDDLRTVLAPRLSEWSHHPRYATATLSALGKKRRPDLVALVLECMEDARVEANVFHYSVACWILLIFFCAPSNPPVHQRMFGCGPTRLPSLPARKLPTGPGLCSYWAPCSSCRSKPMSTATAQPSVRLRKVWVAVKR